MIITKVTTGFVTQRYDTETEQWLEQHFFSADGGTWKNGRGDNIHPKFEGDVPTLSIEMVQPEKTLTTEDKIA